MAMSSVRRAVESGAVGLVVERRLDLDVPQVVVDDARAAMAPFAARFWGEPTEELRRGRRHRNQRQDDDGLPPAGDPRVGRRPLRPAGDGETGGRRR